MWYSAAILSEMYPITTAWKARLTDACPAPPCFYCAIWERVHHYFQGARIHLRQDKTYPGASNNTFQSWESWNTKITFYFICSAKFYLIHSVISSTAFSKFSLLALFQSSNIKPNRKSHTESQCFCLLTSRVLIRELPKCRPTCSCWITSTLICPTPCVPGLPFKLCSISHCDILLHEDMTVIIFWTSCNYWYMKLFKNRVSYYTSSWFLC